MSDSNVREEHCRGLLKEYEPVLRFTHGERFFPMLVEDYLEKCSLYRHNPIWPDRDLTTLWEQWQRTGKPRTQTLGEFKRNDYYLWPTKPQGWRERLWWVYPVVLAVVLGITWIEWGGSAAGWMLSVGIGLALLARVLRSKGGRIVFAGLIMMFACSFFTWALIYPILQQWAFLCIAPVVWISLPPFIGKLPSFVMDLLSRATDSTVESAKEMYCEIISHKKGDAFTCYGRVVEDGEWTALQYLYFYAFNDWRLRAGGMNHHQGDWESVVVFLRCGQAEPYGVAYSAHHQGHFHRWKYVRKVCDANGKPTTHPIIYVALGSHANYRRPCQVKAPDLFKPGPLQWLIDRIDRSVRNVHQQTKQVLKRAATQVQSFARRLGIKSQLSLLETSNRDVNLPTEFATGNGTRIGIPGAEEHEKRCAPSLPEERLQGAPQPELGEWKLEMLSDPLPGWVEYRGLWGVKSLLADESGPPGPQWERAGFSGQSRRQRWENPVAWMQGLERANASEQQLSNESKR